MTVVKNGLLKSTGRDTARLQAIETIVTLTAGRSRPPTWRGPWLKRAVLIVETGPVQGREDVGRIDQERFERRPSQTDPLSRKKPSSVLRSGGSRRTREPIELEVPSLGLRRPRRCQSKCWGRAPTRSSDTG